MDQLPIISSIPLGIIIIDQDGNILFANEMYKERYGRSAVGKKCWQMLTVDKEMCENCPLKKNTPVGETTTEEMLNCSDGRSYEITQTGMLFEGKKAYLEIFKDITDKKKSEELLKVSERKFTTERKRTEDELQRSETKFRTIFQNSPVGIVRFDSQGTITDCNDSYVKIIGAPKEKCIGFNLLKDTKNADFKDALSQAMEGKMGVFEGEYVTVTSNKRLVLKVEFGPIILANGTIDGGIEIVEDFTGREVIEKKLKKHTDKVEKLADELRRFELAVESASDAIVFTDPEGKIVYANKVAGAMTGYGQKGVIGKGISIWGHLADNNNPDQELSFKTIWKTIRENNSTYFGELVNENANGIISVTDLHIAPVFNKNDEVVFYVVTARDITKIKEVDRAKSEFVSLASHELRTPLAGISLASELLLRRFGDGMDEQMNDYLKEIFNSTKKMADIISDLLNISRIELGTFNIQIQEIDLIETIEQILSNLNAQFKEKELSLKCKFDENLPMIFFDRNAFKLIVDNLLTNAIRYTPVGGEIRVGMKLREKEIIVEISDTGFGIPPEESKMVFTKLFRASNAREVSPEGEGLGLYIVKLVADKLGVKVWFKANTKGPGTTFYASIPLK